MTHIAFAGFDRIASGSLAAVHAASRDTAGALIFDTETGRVVDVDPRFPPGEDAPRPGRPRLGVTAREVTLLPRHWDWLAQQPGGASVALRKLVEAAAKGPKAGRNAARDAYRFASAMAGNLPGFEEAGRALFARDKAGFERETRAWPADIRDYARRLAAPAFA